MSNLHDISTKLVSYQLDNHAYPPVLFAYAYYSSNGNVVPMDQELSQAQSDAKANYPDATKRQAFLKGIFAGLYPQYIDNINEFQDGNNTDRNLSDVVTPDFNVLCPSADSACAGMPDGALVKGASVHQLYTVDAYDSSPLITGSNTLNTAQPIMRYQPAWTSVTTTGDTTTGIPVLTLPLGTSGETADHLYQRQLHWRFPSPDSYVTSTTYHIPAANKVLALYADGSVRKLDITQFTARGPDGPVDANNGVSSATFWAVLPSGK